MSGTKPTVKKPNPDAVLKKVRAHLVKHGPHQGTAPALAKAIGITPDQLGRAAQRTRKPEFVKEHGWQIPPTGRGKECVWQVVENRTASPA